ncbi:YopX family protein [Chryseobacterium sp. FH1]|uniref:YopX family protein n=1 Tax=Chryseobacterium sp. FH1 TaxID=1233951 RepID=UPI00068A6938|nr:YopX family protein [Chryseobacterium sp. FH1]
MTKTKFKVWDVDQNKMFYDALELVAKGTMQTFQFQNTSSDNLIWLQFIGLLDKNKKEIYKGDILKTETGKLMVVSWSEKFASFVLIREEWAFAHWFGESCNADDCEIVGNIYQNPELLPN